VPPQNLGYLLAPLAKVDRSMSTRGREPPLSTRSKEWQAILDYIRSLPVKAKGELPVIPVDEGAAEVRAIKAG
jgi:5'-nucleotidase / UDP-sugar diphosphatase